MASVFDVAGYILSEIKYAPTMKLQKLVYYSQAYSLTVGGEPLFAEDFEAWANGPVCPELFEAHKGIFIVDLGDLGTCCYPSALNSKQVACVDHVLTHLGHLAGERLSEIVRAEGPWLDARGGCAATARCGDVISKQAIAGYYSSPSCVNPAFTGGASTPCPVPSRRP